MPQTNWRRVKEALARALEQPLEARTAVLDEMCGGDPAFREEVESLLRAFDAAGTFIEEPAFVGLQIEPSQRLDDDEAPEPNLGRVVGVYRIERCIGRGGMGTVYLARRADNEFDRDVAIKMIRRGMDSELVIRRFRHERQILASLDHPHIASLFDGGTTDDGLPYFVMEYVPGTPIDEYADERRLNTFERLQLCLGVLDAVQHAHDRHVVHRDLKPTNVLVTADGHPKLLDFGIAKLLDAGEDGPSTFTSFARPMTPEYASPEQVRGDPVTPATDVYALGLLLYELLTGHRPHRLQTRTPAEIARVVCELEPERLSTVIARVETTTLADGTTRTTTPTTVSEARDVSPESLRQELRGALEEVVLKALRKEPHERYHSVAALADDLRRYVAGHPVAAARGALRYRVVRWSRRRRVLVGGAALVGAIAIAAFVSTTMELGPPTGAAPGAVAAQAPPRPSVAVVGFRNLSQREADGWLSTAIAEMLTTELISDGQLRVLPTEQVSRAQRQSAPDGTTNVSSGAGFGTDYVVVGTFAVAEGTQSRTVRIDARVQRASGDPIAVVTVADEDQIFSAVAGLGRELRRHLGLKESSPEATRAARAAFPDSLEATRLYAAGMGHLRLLDAPAARDLLEQAAGREPGNPLIQTALASTWTMLGYDGRATEAAKKAVDASGRLNREDRLTVEGRSYEAQREWTKAADVYRTLWGFFADNIEYGLRLVTVQIAAGESKEALSTVAAMRGVGAPQDRDPRIDLAEAEAHAALADFPRELAALRQALDRAAQSGSRLIVARARLLEGRSYYSQGEPAAAERSLALARTAFLEAGDKAGVAAVLNSLGTVLSDQQDISRAQRMYEESLATSEQIGDRRAMSAALNNIGILFKDQRRFTEARQAHERSLAIRRDIGDRNWTAVSLSNIGVVLFEEDRLQDAAVYYTESLALSRAIGDKRSQVRALHNLAIVDRELGRLAPARAGIEESLATRQEMGDKRGVVMARVELGIVLLAQGHIKAARQAEEEALRLARETRLKPGEAQALYQLGEIAVAEDQLAAARTYHQQSLALRLEMQETRTVLESQTALVALALHEGRPADAEIEARRVLAALGPASKDPTRIAVELLTARALLARGDKSAAARVLTTARRLAENSERIDVRRSLAMVEAELDAAQGRPGRAGERLTELRTVLARSGMVLAELESRLLLLHIERAGGQPTVPADARALETDARARDASLIARRVQGP